MLADPLARRVEDRRLAGRVARVTGSTSGIGLGIARALAAAGTAIVLNAFGVPEDIAAAEEAIAGRLGAMTTHSPADLANAAAIERMVGTTAHGISRDKVVREVLPPQQPDKRFASVEEIGALVAVLAGNAAASITGASIAVDRGWTVH
ncbi:SDR family oxidoreductase [Falsiroseomonas sp. HW251]|uniref:SDR family oxidoreductase n=1 Tax=Falsiroseomonas sp. HW251 TaxID=3390998 RepID=UPI003D31BE6A